MVIISNHHQHINLAVLLVIVVGILVDLSKRFQKFNITHKELLVDFLDLLTHAIFSFVKICLYTSVDQPP